MNLMADTMTSPTGYMRAYFKQRGWRLPEDTLTIPNVMPIFKEPTSTLPAMADTRQGSQGQRRLQRLQKPGSECSRWQFALCP